MSDTTGTYTSVYDDLDRLSSFTNPDSKQIQYDYDAASQRIEMIDPDSGVTTYDYDDAGRMISLDNPQSESTAMEYDDAGREIKTELDNGTENTTDYNAANQVVGAATSDGSPVSSYNYGVDGLGNMTSLVDHLGRITNWKYDPTNQLTVDNYLPATGGVAEKSWASLTLFQWDQFTLAQWNTLPLDPTSFVAGSSRLAYSPVGNRSVRIDSDSGTPTTFTYNCGNQVLEAEDPSGVTTYTYDANGNRLTIEEPSLDITTNTWDCENRLVMVEHPDGSVIEYRYNGDGHRVEQLLDSVSEKKWIYDGNTMLMETDGSGTVETAYTYKPGGYGRMVSQRQGTDSSFAHFDGVKNLRMLTDDTGMVTDEYDFDAFGSELSTSGSTLNAHRWKGEALAYYREPDAAPSLQYALHFRNYDPLTGTFPSRDPAEDDSNLYRYVKNNPLNASDPSGLQDPEEADERLEEHLRGLLKHIANLKETEKANQTPTGSPSSDSSSAQPLERPGVSCVGAYQTPIPGNYEWHEDSLVSNLEIPELPTWVPPEIKAYPGEVGRFWKGYFWNGPSNVVTGTASAVYNYDQTWEGIKSAVSDPVEAASTIWNDFQEKSQTTEGQGEILFDLTSAILGATKAAKAAKLKKLNSEKIKGGIDLDDSNVQLDSPAPVSTVRSGTGHGYAANVLEGGTGRAFAGHGELRYGSGDLIVPQGTSITMPRMGHQIQDVTGMLMERGDWDGLTALARTNPKVADDLIGMSSYLPGARIPNLTLKAPDGLTIMRASKTVEDATPLQILIQDAQGNWCWAACTKYRR